MAGGVAGTQARAQGVRARLGAPAAALVLAAAGGLTGCGADPEVEWPEDPVPEPAATVDAAEAQAATEVLAVFDAFREAEVAAQADPAPAHEAQHVFHEFLADPLLATVLSELEMLHQRGLTREGEPGWEATVTELRLDDRPPGATVVDCLDTTGWLLAHRSTGAPADGDGLPARFSPDRHRMEFHATFLEQRWLLSEARTEVGEPC